MTKMFDVRNSGAFRRLRETEKIAKTIFYNAPLFVPGVLQEPAYAQEMISGISGLAATDPEVVERVQVRNERHTDFLDRLAGGDAPQVHAVLDESVLRRAPAGSAAMRKQIEHLIEVSRRPSIHIGVIPLDHGPHEGLAGSFEVHDIDTAGGGLVFFEDAQGDRIEDDAARTTLYRDLANSLMTKAAKGEEALTLMTKLISG